MKRLIKINKKEAQEDLRKIAVSIITASIIGMVIGNRAILALLILLGALGILFWVIGLRTGDKA